RSLPQNMDRPGRVEDQHDDRDDRDDDHNRAEHDAHTSDIGWQRDIRRTGTRNTRVGLASRSSGLLARPWVAGRLNEERVAVGWQRKLAALIEGRHAGDEILEAFRARLAREPLVRLTEC